MHTSPRNRLIFTTLGLLVVLVVVAGFLVVPQVRALSSLDSQLEEARREVEVQKTLLQQREAMKDEAAETDARILALGSLVPDAPDLPALIIELQDVAFASGVKLTAVQPTAPTESESGTYNVIPLDMTIQGTWTDTVDFLQRLPKLSRGVRTVETVAAVTESEELSPYSAQSFIKIEVYSALASPTVDPAAQSDGTSETQ